MISHIHKSIFVHIPKTAGASIEARFGPPPVKWGARDHRSIREIELLSFSDVCRMMRKEEWGILLRRLRAIIEGRPQVSKQQYETYFKFTFVRNPWARIYSWYQHVMRDERFREFYRVEATCTFRNFLQEHLDPSRGPMRPQLYWLVDKNGHIPLDFIGRFEHLQRDWGHVCDALQIQEVELPRLNIGGYPEHYTEVYDQAMADIVARCYAPEIELFGFRFGE